MTWSPRAAPSQPGQHRRLRRREGLGLASDEARVSISGSGNAQVQAYQKLKVSIAGSGDVRYAGSPEVSSSVAGSGSVRRVND